MLLVYPGRAEEVSGGFDGVGFVVDTGHHDEVDAQVARDILNAIAAGEQPMTVIQVVRAVIFPVLPAAQVLLLAKDASIERDALPVVFLVIDEMVHAAV